MARAHIQLALSDDAGGRYNYSYTTCLNSCKDMTYRYNAIRHQVPAGFFVCRVVDLQIITCAVFLLFTLRKEKITDNHQTALTIELSTLMDQTMKVLEAATQRTGSDFASKALEALRSLNQLMDNNASTQSDAITLRIPLLGKVHVSRKGGNVQQPTTASNTQSNNYNAAATTATPLDHEAYQDMTYNAPLPDFGMGWSMDVMDDSPLLPLDTWDANSWMPDMNFSNDFASYPL